MQPLSLCRTTPAMLQGSGEEKIQTRTSEILLDMTLPNQVGEQRIITFGELNKINSCCSILMKDEKKQQELLDLLELNFPGRFSNYLPAEDDWNKAKPLEERKEINILSLLAELLIKIRDRLSENNTQLLPLLCRIHLVIYMLKKESAEQNYNSIKIESKNEIVENLRQGATSVVHTNSIIKKRDSNHSISEFKASVCAANEPLNTVAFVNTVITSKLLDSCSEIGRKTGASIGLVLDSFEREGKDSIDFFVLIVKSIIDIFNGKLPSMIDSNASHYQKTRG